MHARAVAHAHLALAAIAVLVLAAACGPSPLVSGQITDNAITLSADHAPPSVRFELRNTGTEPCDLIVAQTAFPLDAVPVRDGKVVITEDGSTPSVAAITGGEFPGEIEPGAVFTFEIGMEGTPQSDERVVLCNGVGDDERGRYAVLRFDR